MAYAINPIIFKSILEIKDNLKDIKLDSVVSEYWLNFFKWLDYDSFFNLIYSMHIEDFWAFYCKKYVIYCNNI